MSTPMFDHYNIIKEQYKDCIVFYRLGDFYEMFSDDAVLASGLLELTLTARAGEKMCGIPYHAAETYIAKLINLGYKVAICEQLTEAEQGKRVERDVVRVITPGTVTEESILEETRNNYIMCIYAQDGKLGVCYSDITTGEFKCQDFDEEIETNLTDVLSRVMPKEVIGNDEAGEIYSNLAILRTGSFPKFSEYYNWAFGSDRCDKNLKKQFGENYEKVFEIGKKTLKISAGALIEYLNETQKRLMKNINKIEIVRKDNFMTLDINTRRNLELTESARERKKYGSLLWLLDKTKTSMGGRKMRKIFDEPLLSSKLINERLDCVEEVYKKILLRDRLSEELSQINDIERLSGKIAYGNISPKEMIALKKSLIVLPRLKEILANATKLSKFADGIKEFGQIVDLIENAIVDDPPANMKDGGYIKKGFNTELDNLRSMRDNAEGWKDDLEAKEKAETGIPSLKIKFNRVFGYFIEVNKKDSDKVPLYYERKQTVSNNERYITEDLKHLERQILSASEDSIKLESRIYSAIKEALMDQIQALQITARTIAEVDCILSLGLSAVKHNLVKPTINASVKDIKIVGGRHPVVEAFMKSNTFISNDTYLDSADDRIMVITGPNMAGKSTFMRQVALITFMAHIGSFVSATSAEICLTDRIFTRVGASDDLTFGQSTFMVEMSEVANILANATNKSLIILDEIGRGTSTFDGLSIAWAVVEHISKKGLGKTLFATHYHELTELEGVLDGVKNYKVLVKELDDKVVFLHKIVRGGANKSFGIEVARLAGVPKEVLDRAKEISKNLEAVNQKLDLNIFKENKQKAEDNSKLAQSVLAIVKDIDINRISPMTAFDILTDLVNKTKQGE